MAGSFSDYLENKILDRLFGRTVYDAPLTLYIAASTADPTEDGSGIAEPVGNGYERVEVTNSKDSWENAASGQVANKIEFAFPPASGDWGLITHIAIFDTDEGGNMLVYGNLTVQKPINDGDILKLGAGNFIITLS